MICLSSRQNRQLELQCWKKSEMDIPKKRDPEKLLEIARPISSKMIQLRPFLSKEFGTHLSIKNSLSMSLISLLGSMVLHMLFVCIYHRQKHKHRETPLWCGLFCPKNSLVPGREEKIKRTISPSTLTDERETASDIALNAAGHGMKRTASEISIVSSGSKKSPAVKHIQCPSYDTVKQKMSFTSKRLLKRMSWQQWLPRVSIPDRTNNTHF